MLAGRKEDSYEENHSIAIGTYDGVFSVRMQHSHSGQHR